VTRQTVVLVVSKLRAHVRLPTLALNQPMLELRQVTMEDQHCSTSGIELAQLTGTIGLVVFAVYVTYLLSQAVVIGPFEGAAATLIAELDADEVRPRPARM